MTNIFSDKKPASTEVEEDFVGGGSYTLDTDLYTGVLKLAYLTKSKGGANAMNFVINIDGKDHTFTEWMTTKSGAITYVDKKDNTISHNLPGYSKVESACLLYAGKYVGKMDAEDQVVKIYDYDAKKDLPQSVTCFTELHGEEVCVAIQRQTVDKNKDDGSGNYVPTGETRDQNEIVKFLAVGSEVTISEVQKFVENLGGTFADVVEEGDLGKALERITSDHGAYATTWLEKNKGQTYNKAKGAGKSQGQSFDKPAASSEGSAKKSGLFD
jgi:hypothetical protein